MGLAEPPTSPFLLTRSPLRSVPSDKGGFLCLDHRHPATEHSCGHLHPACSCASCLYKQPKIPTIGPWSLPWLAACTLHGEIYDHYFQHSSIIFPVFSTPFLYEPFDISPFNGMYLSRTLYLLSSKYVGKPWARLGSRTPG